MLSLLLRPSSAPHLKCEQTPPCVSREEGDGCVVQEGAVLVHHEQVVVVADLHLLPLLPLLRQDDRRRGHGLGVAAAAARGRRVEERGGGRGGDGRAGLNLRIDTFSSSFHVHKVHFFSPVRWRRLWESRRRTWPACFKDSIQLFCDSTSFNFPLLPCDEYGDPAVCLRPPGHGLYRVDDGQEAVQGHEDKRVDGDERGRDDQELHDLAPEEIKGRGSLRFSTKNAAVFWKAL